MNSDSLNMVSRLGEGHMPCTFFLSEPQLKTTVFPTISGKKLRLKLPFNKESEAEIGTIFHQLCHLQRFVTSTSRTDFF